MEVRLEYLDSMEKSGMGLVKTDVYTAYDEFHKELNLPQVTPDYFYKHINKILRDKGVNTKNPKNSEGQYYYPGVFPRTD